MNHTTERGAMIATTPGTEPQPSTRFRKMVGKGPIGRKSRRLSFISSVLLACAVATLPLGATEPLEWKHIQQFDVAQPGLIKLSLRRIRLEQRGLVWKTCASSTQPAAKCHSSSNARCAARQSSTKARSSASVLPGKPPWSPSRPAWHNQLTRSLSTRPVCSSRRSKWKARATVNHGRRSPMVNRSSVNPAAQASCASQSQRACGHLVGNGG